MPNDTMKLTDASRRLGIPYQRLFLAVAENKVPAERDDRGTRWLVKEADLPTIAATLCVEVPPKGPAHLLRNRSSIGLYKTSIPLVDV